jgi:hypothetical protein
MGFRQRTVDARVSREFQWLSCAEAKRHSGFDPFQVEPGVTGRFTQRVKTNGELMDMPAELAGLPRLIASGV